MKIVDINGSIAWAAICYHVTTNKTFQSITGIVYEAKIDKNCIWYKGGNRNSGDFEPMHKVDFTEAFESIKGLPEINTNTIKAFLPNSVYRKRTPLIGLLYAAGILR